MTGAEIRSYELAYQIRQYLVSHDKTEEQFAEMSGVALQELALFLRNGGPELPVSRITKICDVLSITLDSLVHGPVNEKRFAQLIRKSSYAVKLWGTCLYTPYILYLKRWTERKIETDCLKRYTQWLMYFCYSDELDSQQSDIPTQLHLSPAARFTQKISPRQKEKLEQIIEDSKKK